MAEIETKYSGEKGVYQNTYITKMIFFLSEIFVMYLTT